MAISTYTELQTAVANWLDRDDMSARIPEFISLTEARFNRILPALTALAPTNDILTDSPDVYLYGSLLEAEPFLQNDARVQLWATAFQQAISDIQEQDEKDRHSGELRVLNTGGYY